MKKIKNPYKKAVAEAKRVAKERDSYTCLWCGRSKQGGYQIHASHIFGTGAHPRLAAEPLNIKALCSQCHRKWHSSPLISGEWFKTKYPSWHKELDDLRKKEEGSLKKTDWEKKLIDLKNLTIK